MLTKFAMGSIQNTLHVTVQLHVAQFSLCYSIRRKTARTLLIKDYANSLTNNLLINKERLM